jgi:hypothetical protein
MSKLTEEEITAANEHGKNMYSLVTEVGYNPRLHNLAGLEAVALMAHKRGLQDAANLLLHRGEREVAEKVMALGGMTIQ